VIVHGAGPKLGSHRPNHLGAFGTRLVKRLVLRERLHMNEDAAPLGQPIARNLRRLRADRGLSLAELARRAVIGKSTLSGLERGQGNPSIDTLWSLARALRVPIGALFVDDTRAFLDLLRHDQAPVLLDVSGSRDSPVSSTAGQQGEGDSPAFICRHLLSTGGARQSELYWIDMTPSALRESPGHMADVTEHIIVIKGSVRVRVVDHIRELNAGDRVSFSASRVHSYQAMEGAATLLSLLEYS